MSDTYCDYISETFPEWANEVKVAAKCRKKHSNGHSDYCYFTGILIGLGNAMTATGQCADAFEYIDKVVADVEKGVIA